MPAPHPRLLHAPCPTYERLGGHTWWLMRQPLPQAPTITPAPLVGLPAAGSPHPLTGRTAPWLGLPHFGPLRCQPLSLPHRQAGHN